MAEDNIQPAAAGRMQWLKGCIVLAGLMFVLLPVILCFFLLGRINGMSETLNVLAIRVEALAGIVNLQRRQMEEMAGTVVIVGEGSAREGGAVNRAEGQEMQPPQDSRPPGGEGVSAGGAEPAEEAVRRVYLTFDDGPSKYTGDILDILDRYGVKATFFVLGKESDSAREAVREIAARGHALGMHSYAHKYSEIYSSVESFAADYRKIRDYLFEAAGVDSAIYRFPGGSSNTISRVSMSEFADYLDARGVRFFDWNIASGDGGMGLLSVEELVKNSTADIAKFQTSVILLHDAASKSTTVEALPIIIENILALGDTVILPISEDTELVQHMQRKAETPGD